MSEYRCFNPKVNKPRRFLERKEARAAYKWYIESIPERISILKDFAKEFGYPTVCGSDFLEHLHDLYFVICSEIKGQEKMTALELSIASDIGMYMGDLAIHECDSLSWKFHTFGKTNIDYHQPVIMGFKKVKNSKYSINFESVINAYGYRIIRGQPKEENLFSNMYTACLEKS